MKVVKFCLLPLVAFFLIAGFAAWYFAKDLPTEWNVDVSLQVDASASQVHPFIEDLRRWPEWTVDGTLAADTEFSFEGAERGVGAIMTSSSPGSQVRVTITASDPAKGVWFDELLEGTIPSKGVIQYEERDGKTTLRWQDHGSFGEALWARPINWALERGLTEGFRANLARLKLLVEAPAGE